MALKTVRLGCPITNNIVIGGKPAKPTGKPEKKVSEIVPKNKPYEPRPMRITVCGKTVFEYSPHDHAAVNKAVEIAESYAKQGYVPTIRHDGYSFDSINPKVKVSEMDNNNMTNNTPSGNGLRWQLAAAQDTPGNDAASFDRISTVDQMMIDVNTAPKPKYPGVAPEFVGELEAKILEVWQSQDYEYTNTPTVLQKEEAVKRLINTYRQKPSQASIHAEQDVKPAAAYGKSEGVSEMLNIEYELTSRTLSDPITAKKARIFLNF